MTRLGFIYHSPFLLDSNEVWASSPAIGRYAQALSQFVEHLVIIAPQPSPADAPLYRLNCSNVSLAPLPHYHNIQQFWLRFPAFVNQIKQIVADLDLLTMRMPTHLGFPAFLAAQKYKIPIFQVVVGEGLAWSRLAHYSPIKQVISDLDGVLIDTITNRISNSCLTFTNGTDLFEKLNRSDRKVIEFRSSTIFANDIVLPDIARPSSPPYQIITVATIAPHKGTSLIPEIIAILKTKGIRVFWKYIGKPEGNKGQSELEKTNQRAEELDVRDCIEFAGPKNWNDLQEGYRSSDLFVLPTQMEGIPRVILEAQAAGLPVITARVGGIPFAVKDGYDGLLLEPDDVQGFAGAIENVIRSSDLRKALIQNGIRTAQENCLDTETGRMMRQVSQETGLKFIGVPVS